MNIPYKQLERALRAVLLRIVLCAVLAICAGCDFHPEYTVIFDADGGSPGTQPRTVISGGAIGEPDMPSNPTKSGYTFGGGTPRKTAEAASSPLALRQPAI